MDKKLFAVPTIDGKLCAHFGRCEKFAVVEVNGDSISKTDFLTPPEHQPGTYPKFLADYGVGTIISGGMGPKAQELFAKNNIEVFMGIDSEEPQKLVQSYLSNQLKAGDNQCDH